MMYPCLSLSLCVCDGSQINGAIDFLMTPDFYRTDVL